MLWRLIDSSVLQFSNIIYLVCFCFVSCSFNLHLLLVDGCYPCWLIFSLSCLVMNVSIYHWLICEWSAFCHDHLMNTKLICISLCGKSIPPPLSHLGQRNCQFFSSITHPLGIFVILLLHILFISTLTLKNLYPLVCTCCSAFTFIGRCIIWGGNVSTWFV